ncbi:MAG: SDR family oxidoreductase [Ferrimicrobium sp.]
MPEKRDLSGTVVVLTGASSGIGLAAARLLVHSGASVVVSARRADRLDLLVSELGEEHVVAYPYDVKERDQAQGLFDKAIQAFGRCDSLVASAGFGAYGGILDHTDELLESMIVTNIAGTVWPVRAAVRHFERQGGGDIVIVASVAGLRGGANEAVYASTKFAQVGLAGALDRELRGEGIRVSAICPAGVSTEFAIGCGRTSGDPALDDLLQPEDVAHAIVTVLEQPRRVRTTLWTMWSMAEQS